MKAKIEFVRIEGPGSNDATEPEVVYAIYPNDGDGVYRKNTWHVRVALSLIGLNDEYNHSLNEIIKAGKEMVTLVMDIHED